MNQREKMLAQAKSWLGCNESNGSHKQIIDTYNEAARALGLYVMGYSEPWCAAFITACAWVCKLTDIVAPSALCDTMIAWYKKRGLWKGKDYKPKAGDIVFYDWDGNNTSDHVGIVSAVNGLMLTVIEGNCSDAVKEHTIDTTYHYIQGYGSPLYDIRETIGDTPIIVRPFEPIIDIVDKPCQVSLPILKRGSGMGDLKRYKPWVQSMQQLLIAKHYSCGSAGDDGEFGGGTLTAVKNFQTENNLVVDGVVGVKTWDKLFGG